MAGSSASAATEIIVPARDSWSRMVSSPLGVRVPARQHRRPWPQRASFSSEPACSAGPPPAAPREPGWARAVARQLRHQPPDAPIRSAADSRSRVTVTENSLPGWIRNWQGVRQFWPNEVFASAPGGSDSMVSVSGCGADFMKSRLRLGIVAEHAASMKPHAVTAMTRLMIHTTSAAWGPPLPERRRVTWRLPALALVSALKYL